MTKKTPGFHRDSADSTYEQISRDVAEARRILQKQRLDLEGLGGMRLESVRQIARSALDHAEEFAAVLEHCTSLLRQHEVLLFEHLEIPQLIRRAKQSVIDEYNRTVRTAAANSGKAVTAAEAEKVRALNAEFLEAMPKKGLRYEMIAKELNKQHATEISPPRVRYIIEGPRRSPKARRPRK